MIYIKKLLIVLTAIILLGGIGFWYINGSGESNIDVITVQSSNGHSMVFMNKMINEWNETVGKEKGIRIKYSVFRIDEKNIGSADKENMDFFGGDVKNEFDRERAIPIEELPGGDEIIKRFEQYTIENRHKYNGKTYAVPTSIAPYGLIYNKDMFVEAGIVDENGEAKPPETVSEFIEDARLLTNPKSGDYGFIFPGKFLSWYNDDILKFASATTGCMDAFNPITGKYDFTAEIEIMKCLLTLRDNGWYYPGSEKLGNDAARARFGEGHIGMKTAGSYDYGVLTCQFPASVNWGVAPFPTIDGMGEGYQYAGIEGSYFVSREAVERVGADKIMEVYNWFLSDEFMIEAYKAGVSIPIEERILESVRIDDGMEQWKDFVDLLKISEGRPLPITVKKTDDFKIQDEWCNEVWTGKESIDEFAEKIKVHEDWMNNVGMAEYAQENPDYDPASSMMPNAKLKR